MKLSGISVLPDIGAVFVPDTKFTVIHAGFRHAENFCDLGAFPATHVIFQHFPLFLCQVHGIHQRVHFAVIVLFFLKAIHGIHWQSFVVRKVYAFDLFMPVRSVAQTVDEPVDFTVASVFYCDFFSYAVFAVGIIYVPAHELIQEAYGGLCAIVPVRHGIVYLVGEEFVNG